MMPKFISPILLSIILMLSVSLQLNAQQRNKKDSSSFKLQIDYLNNYAYAGRVDSAVNPYQSISASYHSKNGLYYTGSANYLLSSGQNRFDYFEFDLGYEYELGNKISGELYATKYFYNSNANLINGNISSDIGASFNYDLGLIQFNNTADLFFTNSTDFQYNTGIESAISFGDANKNGYWTITPGIYTNISSINFYESAVNGKFNVRKGAKQKVSTPVYPIVSEITSVTNPGIKLLDYEFTLPISYALNHFNFSFTPSFAIPQSPIYTKSIISTTQASGATSSTMTDSTPYSERYLKNIFVFQLGVSYTF